MPAGAAFGSYSTAPLPTPVDTGPTPTPAPAEPVTCPLLFTATPAPSGPKPVFSPTEKLPSLVAPSPSESPGTSGMPTW
jgi:hypothetical protein